MFRVPLKATPEAIRSAITSAEWTERYGYHTAVEYDLRPRGVYRALVSA